MSDKTFQSRGIPFLGGCIKLGHDGRSIERMEDDRLIKIQCSMTVHQERKQTVMRHFFIASADILP